MSQAGIASIINSNPTIATSYVANVLNVLGTGGIGTTGSGNTLTIAPNPLKGVTFYDDFLNIAPNFNSGYGAWTLYNETGTQSQPTNGVSGHPGIMSVMNDIMSMAVKNTAGATPAHQFVLGDGTLTLTWIIKIPVLSVVGTRFVVNVGLFGDDPTTITPTVTDGIFFSYSDNVNSGRWQINSVSASTATTTNTTSTVDTGWHTFRIDVNSAATSIAFYIDGTQVATSPITTNIPTVALSPYLAILTTSGTDQVVLADYMSFFYNLTTSR
jgi:hypothetical protein